MKIKMQLCLLLGSLGLLAGCATTDYTSADYAAAKCCGMVCDPCSSCSSVKRESTTQTNLYTDTVTPSCEPRYESNVIQERYVWDRGGPAPVPSNHVSCTSEPSIVKEDACFKGDSFRHAYK